MKTVDKLKNIFASDMDSIGLKKKTTILLIVITVFICAGMVAFKYHYILSNIEKDGTEFLFDAKRILDGKGYDSDFWPFGYMVTVAVFKFITTLDFFTSAKLVTFISSIFVLIFTYTIGKHLFSEKIALLSVLVLATNHLFFLHSFLVETDMLFTSLFLLSIYYLIKGDKWKNYFISGSFSGLAYMIKYGIYSIFPLVMILSLISSIERGVTDGLKKMLIFIITFIIFSSPWLINNTIKNGSPSYSKHYINIAWGMNRPRPMPKEYWLDYYKINEKYASMKDVLSDYKKFIKNWLFNIKGLPYNMMRVFSLMIFLMIPAYLMIFREIDRQRLIMVLITFSFLCLTTIAYTWDRYLLPLMPIFSLFIAFGMYEILPDSFELKRVLKGSSINFPFRIIVVTALVVINLAATANSVNTFIKKEHVNEYKVAGEWLKGRLKPDDWLMVPAPQIAWYAETDRFVKCSVNKNLKLEEAVRMREQTPFVFIQEGLSTKICTDINYFIYDKKWEVYDFSHNGSNYEQIEANNLVRVFSTKGPNTEIIIYKVVPT